MWVLLLICVPGLLSVRQYPVYFAVAALDAGISAAFSSTCLYRTVVWTFKRTKKVFLQTIQNLPADDHEIKLTQDKNKM